MTTAADPEALVVAAAPALARWQLRSAVPRGRGGAARL